MRREAYWPHRQGTWKGKYGGRNDDEVERVGEGSEKDLEGKESDIKSFDRKFFRTELALILYEKTEEYHHLIRPIEEMNKKGVLADYL